MLSQPVTPLTGGRRICSCTHLHLALNGGSEGPVWQAWFCFSSFCIWHWRGLRLHALSFLGLVCLVWLGVPPCALMCFGVPAWCVRCASVCLLGVPRCASECLGVPRCASLVCLGVPPWRVSLVYLGHIKAHRGIPRHTKATQAHQGTPMYTRQTRRTTKTHQNQSQGLQRNRQGHSGRRHTSHSLVCF